MSVTLRVNPIACTGHGMCAELLPETHRAGPVGIPDPGLARRSRARCWTTPGGPRQACPTLACCSRRHTGASSRLTAALRRRWPAAPQDHRCRRGRRRAPPAGRRPGQDTVIVTASPRRIEHHPRRGGRPAWPRPLARSPAAGSTTPGRHRRRALSATTVPPAELRTVPAGGLRRPATVPPPEPRSRCASRASPARRRAVVRVWDRGPSTCEG